MLVEFSQEEIKVLVQLVDLAVKAGGLQVAEASVVLVKKLQSATPKKEEEIKDATNS